MSKIHSAYLKKCFKTRNSFKKTVGRICKALRHSDSPEKTFDLENIDAIAATGVSGLTMSSPVAIRLDKDLMVVRKHDVDSHAGYQVEGLIDDAFTYIIIDDCVASGRTIHHIVKEIEQQSDGLAICEGLYLYNDNLFRTKGWIKTTVAKVQMWKDKEAADKAAEGCAAQCKEAAGV